MACCHPPLIDSGLIPPVPPCPLFAQRVLSLAAITPAADPGLNLPLVPFSFPVRVHRCPSLTAILCCRLPKRKPSAAAAAAAAAAGAVPVDVDVPVGVAHAATQVAAGLGRTRLNHNNVQQLFQPLDKNTCREEVEEKQRLDRVGHGHESLDPEHKALCAWFERGTVEDAAVMVLLLTVANTGWVDGSMLLLERQQGS